MSVISAGSYLEHLPAVALARAVRGGFVQSTQLVEKSLSQLNGLGRRLGAVAAIRWSAREEAAAVDRLVADGRAAAESATPFLGVPCSVKEGLKVAGAPWRMGSRLNLDRVAEEDGSVVARLRRAGAIITGLGSMAEMALWPETVNRIEGVARHPHDLRRTPGGSSGGDAALTAARCVPFAIGADGGGSVRIPAAYCGLFGHKPSAGLVPLTGHVPLDGVASDTDAAQSLAWFFAPGPICRHANDLWPLLKVMAGPDGCQRGIGVRTLTETADFDPAGRTILMLARPKVALAEAVSAEQSEVVEAAAMSLAKRGGLIRQLPDTFLTHAFCIWSGTLRASSDLRLGEMLGGGSSLQLGWEVLRRIGGAPMHTLPSLMLATLDRVAPMRRRTAERYFRLGAELAAELSAMLGDGGVLLLPPVPGVAPRHGHALLRPFNIAYTALFNALGLPATVAPVSVSRCGLPLGVQIVSSIGNDSLTIGAAVAIADSHSVHIS